MNIKWSFSDYEGYSNDIMLIGDYGSTRFVTSCSNTILGLWWGKLKIKLKFYVINNR